MIDQRQPLLNQWASAIDKAARVGALTGDAKSITIKEIGTIAGPRAGALELDAGFDAGRLLRTLAADDMALSRWLIGYYRDGSVVVGVFLKKIVTHQSNAVALIVLES